MRSANQIKIVLFVKLAHYVLSKGEAYASVIVSVCIDAALGVGP